MKKHIFVITNLILSIFLLENCYSQGWNKLPVVITGSAKGDKRIDSITIVVWYDYNLFGFKTYNIPIDRNGDFYTTLDEIKYPATLRLQLGNQGILTRLVEPGDSLKVEAKVVSGKLETKFTGNNTVKYECEDSIDRFLSKVRELPYLVSGRLEGDFQKLNRYYFNQYVDVLKILEGYNSKINPSMLNYLAAKYTQNTIGIYNALLIKEFTSVENSDKIKENIIATYNSYKLPDYNIDQKVASHSEFYIMYIITKCQNDLLIKSRGKGYTYKAIYSYFKANYSGVLLERLLTYFLLYHRSSVNVIDFKPSDFDFCFNDAISLVTEPVLKQALINKINLKSGSSAFNFSLPDTTGNIQKLSDFRGNVVLMDMWFNGCTGCAEFFDLFQNQVFPKLKNESKFKVVSINMDSNKNRWLEGINSGLYTDKDHINLTTGGIDHPIVKFYKLSAFPFILLMDKEGKVFSKIEMTTSPAELTKMIRMALNH